MKEPHNICLVSVLWTFQIFSQLQWSWWLVCKVGPEVKTPYLWTTRNCKLSFLPPAPISRTSDDLFCLLWISTHLDNMVPARQLCVCGRRSLGWVHQVCWDGAVNIHPATQWTSMWSPRLHMILDIGAGGMPVQESGTGWLGHCNGSAQINQQFSSKHF